MASSGYRTARNGPLAHAIGELPPESVIFGTTPGMQAVREKLARIAVAEIPVLITGESGTGKEVVAKYIHKVSPWNSGPFVKVNCAAIPGSLFESELFGYEQGAFTGAVAMKRGRVELAQHGTLFMDEISELDVGLQTKLLHLLQDGQFCRIGAQANSAVEARVVCATNRVLEHDVERGSFRSDLYYRVNVMEVRLRPLRERLADIPMLAQYFIDLYNEKYRGNAAPLSEAILRQMQSFDWPGNIRQFENVIRKYTIFQNESVIATDMVTRKAEYYPSVTLPMQTPFSLKKITRMASQELEGKIILQVLEANGGNRKRTARALNISYRALLYKIRQAGVPSRSYNKPVQSEKTE